MGGERGGVDICRCMWLSPFSVPQTITTFVNWLYSQHKIQSLKNSSWCMRGSKWLEREPLN